MYKFESIVQMDKALQHISSRVDELALQPEVYSARMDQQLQALQEQQRSLQARTCVAVSPG